VTAEGGIRQWLEAGAELAWMRSLRDHPAVVPRPSVASPEIGSPVPTRLYRGAVRPTSLLSGFEPRTDTREEWADDARSDCLVVSPVLPHRISGVAETPDPSAGMIV